MIEQDVLDLQCSCSVKKHYRRRLGVLHGASAQCAVSDDTASHDTSLSERARQQICLTSMGCCRGTGQRHCALLVLTTQPVTVSSTDVCCVLGQEP